MGYRFVPPAECWRSLVAAPSALRRTVHGPIGLGIGIGHDASRWCHFAIAHDVGSSDSAVLLSNDCFGASCLRMIIGPDIDADPHWRAGQLPGVPSVVAIIHAAIES